MRQRGPAAIHTGADYELALPYVYDSNQWKPVSSKIYMNSQWKKMGQAGTLMVPLFDANGQQVYDSTGEEILVRNSPLISFMINGVMRSVIKGTSWRHWCNTQAQYSISPTQGVINIAQNKYMVEENNLSTYLNPDSAIIGNKNYILGGDVVDPGDDPGTGGGGGDDPGGGGDIPPEEPENEIFSFTYSDPTGYSIVGGTHTTINGREYCEGNFIIYFTKTGTITVYDSIFLVINR